MGPLLGDQQGSARLYRFVSRFYDTLRPLFAGFESTRKAYYSHLELGPTDRVLDLGCGTGESTKPLVGDRRSVHGVDLTSEQIGETRRKRSLSAASFVVGDAMQLPYRDDTFDVVASVGSLQHVPDVEQALAEAHRVAVDGGQLFVVGPQRPESRIGGTIADALMHFMEEPELRRHATEAGWAEIDTHLLHMDYLAREALVLTARA